MIRHYAVTLGCAALLAGCATTGATRTEMLLRLESRSGSHVTGVLRLTEGQGPLRLRATVNGLPPGATVGFHLHEQGDCSASDATSAGGHWNPAGAPHGRFGHGPHHAGDLPSLKANRKGVASVDVVLTGLTLRPGEGSIANRAFIVHAQADDYTTQPTGNAGARVACAVVR